MALIIKDRIKEVTTTTGTGDIVLGGSSATYDSFGSCMSNGDTTYYAIVHTVGGTDEWEVGLGTYNSTTDAIARTTISASSNGGSAVNFSAGTKNIFITNPADKAVYLNADGNIELAGTIDGRDLSVDGAKLDGIEAGATADQTKADIDALNIDADLLDGQHGSYYTAYADTAVANLVDSAPGTLNTLNELAAALGDDPNFATTVTNSIATKLPLAGGTMTGNLDVGGTIAADNNITVSRSTVAPSITMSNSNYGGGDASLAYFDTGSLLFRTNGTEQMRIDANGNVGINKTQPSEALDVVGNIKATGSIDGEVTKIRAWDVRSSGQVPGSDGTSSYMPAPSDEWLDKSTRTLFSQDGGGSSWSGILSVKGWNSSTYGGWQLSGTATTSTWGDLYFRDGVGGSWGTWRKLLHDGQTTITVDTQTNGASTFDGSGAGVQLIAGGMNTTSKYTPSLQFGSHDPELSPTPKMLASIVGRARQTYGASDDGGMALDFFTTPNDSGSGQQAVHAMTIDHNGLVGIGTTAPDSQLHVYGAGQTTANLSDSGNQGGFIRVSDNGSLAGSGGGVIFASTQSDDTGAVGMAAIKGLLSNGTGNTIGDLAFSTRANTTATALTERMRITATGLVGIGASNPSTTLHVDSGAANIGARFHSSDDGSFIAFSDNSSATWSNQAIGTTGDDLRLNTGNITRLTVSSTGDVGIGTTAPQAELDVRGYVDITTGTGSATFGSTNTSWFHMTTDRPSFYMNKGLKAAGDVGVYGQNTYLTGADMYLDGVIRHYGDTNTYMQFHASDQWRVVVGNVERLEVTTTGIGIKGVTPSVALDVNGSIEYTGTITDVSDDRLKENKVQITGALDAIKSLTGYTYNMVYEDEDQTEMGLIAQDVQAVLPVAVKNIKIDTDGDGTDEDYLGVSYIQLIAPMIEAIKEQQQQIEALEARIAVLEG